MPLIKISLSQNVAAPYQTPHTDNKNAAPLAATLTQTAAAPTEETRRVLYRHSIVFPNAATVSKPYACTIIAYAALVAVCCAYRVWYEQEPLTTNYVMGETVRWLVSGVLFTHINSFKGRTRRSWNISRWFRYVLWFAFFAVSDNRGDRVWAATNRYWLTALVAAVVFSEASLLWQFVWRWAKQKYADSRAAAQ